MSGEYEPQLLTGDDVERLRCVHATASQPLWIMKHRPGELTAKVWSDAGLVGTFRSISGARPRDAEMVVEFRNMLPKILDTLEHPSVRAAIARLQTKEGMA